MNHTSMTQKNAPTAAPACVEVPQTCRTCVGRRHENRPAECMGDHQGRRSRRAHCSTHEADNEKMRTLRNSIKRTMPGIRKMTQEHKRQQEKREHQCARVLFHSASPTQSSPDRDSALHRTELRTYVQKDESWLPSASNNTRTSTAIIPDASSAWRRLLVSSGATRWYTWTPVKGEHVHGVLMIARCKSDVCGFNDSYTPTCSSFRAPFAVDVSGNSKMYHVQNVK